ncbi:MAG: dTMP kinase [Candidatus Omnitrophica bacterium CG1_02_46_14]|nr:MAG: dTMP kinase [Candidatus Omnitrophica bacterium CG1_02_46_14]
MKTRKGILITLEGNEGCGKSTQIKLLYDYLKKEGHSVYITREPGGTHIGNMVRRILLDPKNKEMTAVCETLLYMASRAQLIQEVVIPKLKEGKVVLCDRWLDATLAYQGYGGGVDLAWIRSLGSAVTQGVNPNVTIFMDLPVSVGLKRATSFKKADRMEQKKVLFHQKVHAGYVAIARHEKRRIKHLKIKKNDTIWIVHDKIKAIIKNVLSKNK